MRTITIRLLDADLERLAELRRLYEQNGRTWLGDELMVVWLMQRGLIWALDDERIIAELFEARPDLHPSQLPSATNT